MTAPLVNTQAEFPLPSHRAARRQRYRLRDAAAAIAPGRVARCGRVRIAETVTIRSHDGRCSAEGWETCGSVWTCPVCAGKIMRERQQEVRQAMTNWGGSVYMMAFTSSHFAQQRLWGLRGRTARSWRKMLSGAPWKRAKLAYGIGGYIRALEVTYGRNGWHPHLHVLFFVDRVLTEAERAGFEGWLFDRWDKIVQREGAGRCNRSVFRLERASTPEAAGDYVAKWGADYEITHLHAKRAKGGGATPWDLLDLAARGDGKAKTRFKEYAIAMKGARHLTWSRGLKRRVGLLDVSDEDLASESQGEAVLILDGQDADKLRRDGKLVALLECAEQGGAAAAISFIEAAGASIRTDEARRRRRAFFGEIGDEDAFTRAVERWGVCPETGEVFNGG